MNDCIGAVDSTAAGNGGLFHTQVGPWKDSVQLCTARGPVFTVRVLQDCSWELSFANRKKWKGTMAGFEVKALRDVCQTVCQSVRRAEILMNRRATEEMA